VNKLFIFLLAALAPGLALADPISAIVAIATMASAAGGVGAIGGVIASGMAGMSLAAGAMFAGGAIGLVGAVTKNEKLTRLGGVLGLVGGVGQMFTSLAQAGASAGATAAELASDVGNVAQEAAGAASGGLQEAGQLAAEQAAQDAATSAAAAKQTAQDAAFESAPKATYSHEAQAQLRAAEGARAAEVVNPESATAAKDAVRGARGYGVDGMTGKETAAYDAALKSAPPETSAQFGQWLKDNKELANLGGGILKGAGEMYTQSRPSGNMQAAQERDELNRQRFNDSIKGLNPVNRYKTNWDPTAQREVRDVTRFVSKRPGLIRQAGG
jgi:hypothetical protein